MSSTTQKKILAAARGERLRKYQARKLSMSPAPSILEEQLMTILQEASGQPMTIPQIEETLKERFANTSRVDTFDVRAAVWRLVARRKAQFTPRRYVEAANE